MAALLSSKKQPACNALAVWGGTCEFAVDERRSLDHEIPASRLFQNLITEWI
jgi:hypothetical protein